MARFLEGYKPKKKKKEETVKKVQSPSVSTKTQNRAQQAQQQKMYGGTKQQPVKRAATNNSKTTTQKRQQTTSQQTQRTVDRLQQKYGQNRVERQEQQKRFQPNANTQRMSRNPRMLDTSGNINPRTQSRQERESRLREAQRQKMGLNSMASKETQEAANRAIRNTPSLVTKAVKDTVSGHLQTMADITEMTAEKGTRARALKMGIEDNPQEMRKLEQRQKQTAQKARLDREKWAAEQDKRQQDWDKKVNGAKGAEKAYYGAVESGTGMLTDLALGLGTQGGSLAAMFSRTYGTTRGQAQKEGATEAEDRTYSFLQAAKEVGTELMFPGVGLAKGYAKKTGLPLAERVANNLTSRIANRTAADLTGAGVRLLGGTAEENLEEVAGFGLDPLIKEFSYGRNVRTRQKMADLQTESDQLRANIQSEDDARRVASYLSSSEWLDQNKQQYMEAGLSEKDAQEVAEKMRDYMTASLKGDTETMDVLEQEIASTLSKGEFSYTKSLDKSELMDTLASTTLLTLTTGLPGTATTAMRGSVIRDNLGEDGIRTLAESAMNYEDEEASKRGEVARDRLNAGQELTASEVYELAASQAQQVEKDTRRVVAKNNVVADTLESDRLVAPMIMRDEKGNIHGDPVITQRYNDSAQEAESALKDLDKEQKLSLSDSELAVGSRAIAGFQTGAFTINDANALNYTNTAVREAFEKVTGVDLGQYVVKTSSGAVDYAATNAATKDALFTMAADNFIETARAETENFKDIAKGITAEQMAARVGSEGDIAISTALDTVDPADEDTYGLMASAAQNVYEYGRFTEDTWDDVSANLSEMYPGLSQEALQDVYDAAKRDKAIAENPYYNARITAGESTRNMDMSEAEQAEYGKFTNDTGEDIGMKERAVLESLAREFNINIRLLPSEFFEYKYVDKNGKEKTAYSNGSYDPKTGTMLLNGGNDMDRNLIAVALHETTHHIAIYAPEEYLALSNRVMETWYKNDRDAFNAAIKRKQDSYKAQVKQNLSEEQALEEVIADAMGEMASDPDFISQICTDEPSLAEQIIKAIKSVLRKLRAILASGNVSEEYEDAFFNQLGIWDDAQRLWLEAAKVAQQQRANQMIDDWDAQARQSINDANITSYSTAAYSGQVNMRTEYKDNSGKVLGYVEWNDYEGTPNISYISVDEGSRRQGIATRLLQYIQRQYPDTEINFGMTTEDGTALLDAITHNVVDADLQSRQDELAQKSQELEDIGNRLNELYEIEDWTEEQDAEASELGPRWDALNREVHDLSDEVGNRSATRRMVNMPKTRFSIDEPVERVNDLIAVHNLKADDIRNAFDLGGFPMPSIAITKDSMGHDEYGDITLMFHSDTIDPEFFRSNQVFGGDAWTPTFPSIAKKVSRQVADRIDQRLRDILGLGRYDYTLGDLRLPSLDDDNLTNALRYNEPYDAFKNDEVFQIAYLKNAKNFDIAVPTKEGRIRNLDKQALEHLDDRLPDISYDDIYDTVDHTMEFEPAVRQARKDYYESKGDIKLKALAKHLDEKMGYSDVLTRLEALLKYRQEGIPEVTDRDALKKKLNEQVDQDGFKAWIDDLFDGIIEKTGIRNNKDMFTSLGNRRSWEALHDPVTLENVVKVMKSELAAGGNGLFGSNPKGAAQKQYKSLDEIRADEDRLQMLSEEEYKAESEVAVGKMSEVCVSIAEHNPGRFSSSFGAALDVGSYVAEILNSTRNKSTIKRKLNNDYNLDTTDAQMDDLMEAIDAIANLPTGYFEAKPRRAVGFDEVKAAIIPNNLDDDIKKNLTDRGIPLYEYDYGLWDINSELVNEDRKRAVNEAATAQDLRFSITDSEGSELSPGQAEFFANSKMVDAEGRLKPMYHGTQSEFYEFDITKAYPGTLGRGFYFSDSDSHAGVYGKTNKYYLNLVNPLMSGTNTITKDQLRRFVTELAENEDYGLENYGYGATVDSVVDSVWGKSDFAMLRDLNLTAVGDFAEALKVFNRVNDTDYDGIITDTETIAFYPQQVKSVDNLNPTLSKDTRYSITDSDGKELSDGQVDYFKDSQARDEQKRLVPVYHGTQNGGFTIFDSRYGISSRFFFFVDRMSAAKGYSGSEKTFSESVAGEEDMRLNYKVYLDMVNPLIVDAQGNSWAHIPYEDDFVTTNWLAEYAEAEGYDGVIVKNVIDRGSADTEYAPQTDYIVFNSNQIKDTRNENPTENPDIRYSIVDDEEAQSKMAYDDAMDTSYEALSYYETLIDEPEEQIELYAESFSEEKMNDFYAGLNSYSEYFVFDDPVLEEGRKRMARSRNDFMERLNAEWNERWLTDGEILDIRSVRKDVREMVKSIMRNADTPNKVKNDIVNKTLIDIRLAYQFAKKGRIDVADALLWHTSMRMIEGVEFVNDDTFNEYKDLRDYLRTTRIQLGEEYWSDVDYQAFRKNNFGRMKLVKGETNVDEIYQEMCERWPEWFNEEKEMTPPDQLLQIEHVLDVIQPYKEAYSSEEAASIATDIAYDLSNIVYGKGRPYESLADKYKNRYDKQAQAMRQRHEEALRRVKEQRDKAVKANRELKAVNRQNLKEQRTKYEAKTKDLKEKHREDLRNAKEEAREKAQERERARWEAKEKKRKERQLHGKTFDSIVKSYKWLSERLLTNTKDKHIPEQYKKELAGLLAAFDLQTVRSKKLEIKNGLYYRVDYKSQKTIKMEAMKKAINNIEAKSEFFHVNDSITDIIDELLGRDSDGAYKKELSIEGKTIDALSSDELKKIDKLLKALKHEFIYYETVRTGAKRTQAADIGTAQVDSSLKHAELFGPGKDYNNITGALDKILNMDEMTPAYVFKRIDPNNTGIGMMFKELRRSFDKYVKNQEQLNGWMEEILSPYHSGGKLWKKYGAEEIEDWRRAKATNTFKLQSGDEIRLTPAQMMSVYCLAKRPQAYQHMVGAGIVIKPVTYQAKLETDFKRKTNWALPTILSDGDIKMISTALTPEQKQVADQLQQLMATKMAAWGNEASRAVIGIDLFEDPDYFPIQSDRAALEEDFTADQFVDMIRNFGFTKAVQPGARNAIAIDDIFTVVSTHCNNMNLYNAYSESMNDFMKVYNYHALREDGSDYSVKQAIAHAYSQKATTFISTFMRDLNGNVSKGRVTGIDNMMNAALGNAKKASVFANGRVALQQPTAIVRAFSVISPKYLKGIKPSKGAMKEMFEHCPIALWKSWGYYDINMGKSVEDIMMNNGSWLDDKMTDIYGAADNVTWTAIWQMCKAEVKDKNPNVKEGSNEFWDLVNERMSEVVDFTQVVDSPFHRSHAMRDKQILVKMATSFMAEPTLTFNMVRDGLVNSYEMYKLGDKGGAAKLLGKTSRVFVLSAFATAAAAAIWDAVRGKQPDGDDDGEGNAFDLWWANTIANFQDNLKLWNSIYYIKDISSLFDGWGTSNLALQGWKQLADGYAQLTGAYRVNSKKAWWENMLAGIGYLSGTPYGTILKDGKALLNILGVHPSFLSAIGEQLDSVQDMLGGSSAGSGVSKTSTNNESNNKKAGSDKSDTTSAAVKLWTYDNAPFKVEDGSPVDKFLNRFGVNLTAAEIAAADAQIAEKEHQERVDKIKESLSEYSGEEYDKHLWDKSDMEGYGKAIAEGDFKRAEEIEKMFVDCGGSQEFIDEKKLYHYNRNYVKTIVYDPTDEQIEQQQEMKEFLLSHGVSETELSERVYKSQTTKELKVAFRLNDEDAIIEELKPLIRAGLSYDDFVKAYDNRNRVDLKKYKDSDGKYAERLKSTGVYNWPITGQITSNFGHRSSPGGIGSTNHQGLDIAGNMGDPVGAADGGTVVYAGWYGGAGKTVMIEHDDGTITQYSHLSWWDAKVGDTVAQGQTIGKVGSTGNSTGPHLHFGVKVNGSYVDPLTYLN